MHFKTIMPYLAAGYLALSGSAYGFSDKTETEIQTLKVVIDCRPDRELYRLHMDVLVRDRDEIAHVEFLQDGSSIDAYELGLPQTTIAHRINRSGTDLSALLTEKQGIKIRDEKGNRFEQSFSAKDVQKEWWEYSTISPSIQIMFNSCRPDMFYAFQNQVETIWKE